jgi:histidinol-phosphate aminotransferase
VDAYGAEHLEVVTRDAASVARRVRNAGCVFAGAHSPVSLGDYLAGSNHVLPTGGTCRHTAGLSVQTFLRGISLVEYDEEALVAAAPHIVALAHAEDLPAHANAVTVRTERAASDGSARPGRPVTIADLPLRDDLRGRNPHGAPQLDVPVRLNTNENSHPLPAGLPAAIGAAAAEVAGGLNRYPDREASALRADLARYLGHGLSTGQVWVANGSNEVLQQLLQAFGGPGRAALGFVPSYSMHEIIATGTGTRWVAGVRDDDFTVPPRLAAEQVLDHRPSVVFLTSPNNPTGTALPLRTVEAVLEAAPGMVVVDEAYAEFARPGTRSALDLLRGRPRLVVTRTMSKAFGMAGLRVGYLAADPAVVDALQLVRLPYHLSTLTQAVARVALAHAPELLATVQAVKQQRDRIVAALQSLGLTVVPSDANFVLFGRFADARAAWEALLARGVLVRDPGLAGWLRVTAGTEREVNGFLAALGAVVGEVEVRSG